MIECARERRPVIAIAVKDVNQRTKSSREAQELLKVELERALRDEQGKDIVVIAHSQRCLLLRLALEDLFASKGTKNGKTMEDVM